MQNDLILRIARGEQVERTPVWLMRQAGRILPEYRAVRGKLSGFKELVETPELACEVTLQPVDILGVDAAIIFSDILVVPEAMGLPYQMIKGKGPWFEHRIRSREDFNKLHIPNPNDELSYVLEAIKLTTAALNGRVPLIGFAGAPWTIFSYMVEGSGSKTFSEARKMLVQNPQLSHEVLDAITTTTISYLKAQVEAGAQMLQLFDSWAGILNRDVYMKFGFPYVKRICDAINEVPITVFAKGAWWSLADFDEIACNTIGIDWHTSVPYAKQQVKEKALQGNLDPCLLYGDDNDIVTETKKMLDSFGSGRHIANLGHGVYPDTNPDKVKVFIETVKNHFH